MARKQQAMHVARTMSRRVNKAGVMVEYESVLLRRSFRQDGKVRHETLANLSALPEHAVEALRTALAGNANPGLVSAAGLEAVRSLPHGHVAAVAAQAKALGMPALLGRAGKMRDIAFALVIARVCRPGSKLATTRWWADTTLASDLGVAGATTDEVYAAMDWLAGRQDAIEKTLASRHLSPEANPDRLALFDLSSSWVTGHKCPLAARGYSRDGKKGLEQIEYGLLTDPAGRPVSVRVVPGNTADPAAFEQLAKDFKTRYGLQEMDLVGDRGMITNARIEQLKELGGLGWVTALRAPAIQALAADDGPLQMSLFDEQNLAEIAHPDYPGERLIACRNPALAAERARKRTALLAATETELAKITAAAEAGRLKDAGKIGVRAGKVVGRYKMEKHYTLTIDDTSFTWTRNEEQIAAEAALDGIYIIRTTVNETRMDAGQVVATYKSLANVERDFRSIKAIDLHLRPVHHYTETRVRAHVFICMLAAYLTWHLRKAWAPLTNTCEHRPEPANPVAPAERSTAAQAKASRRTTAGGQAVYSFRSLLDHLGTLTRNRLHLDGTPDTAGFDLVTTPTPVQRQAFELIGQPIPTTIGGK
ncbi:IS1634 family transposase [Pseudarthrobacter albicanus]|uniref:IS1634 family transposase n=1 Tax=Pseudarthrobacter albicanus TaxID=2823873 RepID=UPI001BA970D8|nr:IS1634 family transposase [Pseudarthrobacter albicanus]